MSEGTLRCTTCGAVWASAAPKTLIARSESCLRCGGRLVLVEEPLPAPPAERPELAIIAAHDRLAAAVAARLAALGVPQRLISPDGAKAPRLAGAEVAEASYEDPGTIRAALSGIKTLLVASAKQAPERVRQNLSAIDAAIAAGVERIVYVSAIGAAAGASYSVAADHFRVEEYALAAGVAYTFLRPSPYLDLLPALASAEGVIQNSAKEGRVACVARADVADVALTVLTQVGHDGQRYDLTGPEALTMAEIAHQLALASGRAVSYESETLDEARRSWPKQGLADFEIEGCLSCFEAIAAGEMEIVTDTVAKLSGHDPQSFPEYLRQHPESYRQLVSGWGFTCPPFLSGG